MAVKSTTKAPAAAAASAATAPAASPAAAAAPAKPKTVDTFKFVKQAGPGDKLAPQARVIVNQVELAGETGIERSALVTACTGKIVTRQPVGRIITYYQKTLVDGGFIKIEQAPVAA